ncbi:MAG: helix-turn-helix domain-containing protein [Solirubrobacteraceae bacterium]
MAATPATLLPVSRVGEILGVSRVTAYRLLAQGALPHIRVGGRRLVEPDALQRFIDQARFDGPVAANSHLNDDAPGGQAERDDPNSTIAAGPRDNAIHRS